MTAMSRASDPSNSELIKREMEKLQGIELVTHQNFSFGPDHSPKTDIYLYRIDKAGIHEVNSKW